MTFDLRARRETAAQSQPRPWKIDNRRVGGRLNGHVQRRIETHIAARRSPLSRHWLAIRSERRRISADASGHFKSHLPETAKPGVIGGSNPPVVEQNKSRMRDLSLATKLFYSSGSIGTGTFYAFNNFVLPPILKSFGAPDLLIGLLSSTRSIEGAVIQPTIGALSDRVWTRFGRRRPFMLIGIPLSALFFVAGAFVNDLLLLAAVIFLFSIFFNVAVDPYTALLADIARLEQRGWLSGVAVGVQLFSSVAFLVVIAATTGGGSVPVWVYVLVAAVLLVSFGLTVFGIHEPRHLEHETSEGQDRLPLRAYLDALLEQRQAMRYLGTLFVYQFGLNAIVPFLVLYIQEEIHQTQQVAFALSAALLVFTAIGAVVFGKLSTRLGTRRVLAIGWALLAVSAVGGVLVTSLAEVSVVVVVAGIGNGAA